MSRSISVIWATWFTINTVNQQVRLTCRSFSICARTLLSNLFVLAPGTFLGIHFENVGLTRGQNMRIGQLILRLCGNTRVIFATSVAEQMSDTVKSRVF